METLDQSFIPEKVENVARFTASSGKRLGNYFIDLIIVRIIEFGFGMIYAFATFAYNEYSFVYEILFSLLISLAYYTILETTLGKTIGKFVTRTRVVTVNGEAPTVANVVGRTLCRWIPFEAFSFLGSKAIGWHDTITNTRVIDEAEYESYKLRETLNNG